MLVDGGSAEFKGGRIADEFHDSRAVYTGPPMLPSALSCSHDRYQAPTKLFPGSVMAANERGDSVRCVVWVFKKQLDRRWVVGENKPEVVGEAAVENESNGRMMNGAGIEDGSSCSEPAETKEESQSRAKSSLYTLGEYHLERANKRRTSELLRRTTMKKFQVICTSFSNL
ncbi:hypothetical protein BDQ12DRAFT_712296 [Crucibulum laeve]|uniref:Uncharacterized protein n=1 Tax=Crucibulum laeve TaxID=68775 RepID=A0A5C3M403_9AGAR|nr:hypothetical protein BDQ12DRAFT_712296 [Crucibulum laeve]